MFRPTGADDTVCHVPLDRCEIQGNVIVDVVHESDPPRRCEEYMFCLKQRPLTVGRSLYAQAADDKLVDILAEVIVASALQDPALTRLRQREDEQVAVALHAEASAKQERR